MNDGPVTTLRVGADNRLLTATEYVPDPSAKVWAMGPEGELKLLAHVRTAAHGAALSPAGDLIATGTINGDVELWSALTGKSIKKMGDLKGRVGSLDFSPDGKLLVAGCRLGFAHAGPGGFTVWEVESGKVVKQVPDAGAIVRFLKEGNHLIADKGNSLRLWNSETWKEVVVIPGGLASLDVRPSLDVSNSGELACMFSFARGMQPREFLRGVAGEAFRSGEALTSCCRLAPPRLAQELVTS